MNEYYRQGEILFQRIEIPKGARPKLIERLKKVENNVIREGEVSGHMHEVVGNGCLMAVGRPADSYVSWNEPKGTTANSGSPAMEYKSYTLPDNTDMVITADNAIEIRHPEHGSLKLPKGDYRVVIQQEYDELQNINVAD